MNITTAIAILEKERQFLGLGMLELLTEIQADQQMVYSDKVMKAYRVFMADASKLFATA